MPCWLLTNTARWLALTGSPCWNTSTTTALAGSTRLTLSAWQLFQLQLSNIPNATLTYRLSIKGEYHTLFAHSKRIKTEDGTILFLVTYFDLGNDQSQQDQGTK